MTTGKTGMGYRLLTLILIAFSTTTLNAYSGSVWEVDRDNDGVKVYTRWQGGSEIKAFKGVAEYEAALDEVVEVLYDVDNYTQWFGNTEKSKFLGKNGDLNFVYIETIFPWPYSNRDLVYGVVVDKISPEKILITINGLPEHIPDNKDRIRMKQASGRILITSSGNKTKIVYEFHCEPGDVPSWLANKLLPGYPFSTLSGLKKQIEEKRHL